MKYPNLFLFVFLCILAGNPLAQTHDPANFSYHDFPDVPVYVVKDSVVVIEPEAYYDKTVDSDIWELVQNNDAATGSADGNGCTDKAKNVFKEVGGTKFHEQIKEYTGSGYLKTKIKGEFCNNNGHEGQKDPEGECVGKQSEWFVFKIYVPEGEKSFYNVNFRCIHSQEDGDNDVWLGKLGYNDTKKVADCNHDIYTYYDDFGIYTSPVSLSPGIHAFFFAPRSKGFGIDRITMYSSSDSKWRDGLPLSNPVSDKLNFETGSVSKSTYAQSESVSVPFNVSHDFVSGNTFTAQLSDANGSFDSPADIGSMSGTSSGTIDATIPSSVSAGSGYRIRVIADNPAIKASDNGSDITIEEASTTVDAGKDTTVCQNSGTLTFTGSPEGGTWSGDNISSNGEFQTSDAGSFTLTYTVDGSSDDKAVTVTAIPDKPSISQTVDDSLKASVLADSYIWMQDGSEMSASSQIIQVTQNADYTVKALSEGCESPESDPYEYSITGIAQQFSSKVQIYPNPAEDYFVVKGQKGNINVRINNLMGNTIKTQQTLFGKKISTQSLSSGLYLISIERNGFIKQFRLAVK